MSISFVGFINWLFAAVGLIMGSSVKSENRDNELNLWNDVVNIPKSIIVLLIPSVRSLHCGVPDKSPKTTQYYTSR